MIYAILNHRGAKATLDLSKHWSYSLGVLQERLFYAYPEDLRLYKWNEGGLSIKLESDDEFGKSLIKLLTSKNTLMDAYTLVNEMQDDAMIGKLKPKIMDGKYKTTEELLTDIIKIKRSQAPFIRSFYCPIKCCFENGYGGYNQISEKESLAYETQISTAIKKEQTSKYYLTERIASDSGIKDKLQYIEWNVAAESGKLYGRIDCFVTEDLTDTEEDKLCEKILIQNKSGFGDDFWGRQINTVGGELHVLFFHEAEDYFICPERELENYIVKDNEIVIGGI